MPGKNTNMRCLYEAKQIRFKGVHMVGPNVTELISDGTALIGLGATSADLSRLIHSHPTVSKGLMEAAQALYRGAAIHI